MIRSRRSVWGIHCDIVSPRLFELKAAKENLAEIYDIPISEVDNMIRQRITESSYSSENLCCMADYRRTCLS